MEGQKPKVVGILASYIITIITDATYTKGPVIYTYQTYLFNLYYPLYLK